MTSGGYEPVASELFTGTNLNGFFMEYDSERAGYFLPLRFIKDQQIVLGLMSTKSGQLENKDTEIKRTAEAARYVPISQLCLSPQCGFASTEEGNILSEEEQWAKVLLVTEIASEIWK